VSDASLFAALEPTDRRYLKREGNGDVAIYGPDGRIGPVWEVRES
jgi:hypothetical protein